MDAFSPPQQRDAALHAPQIPDRAKSECRAAVLSLFPDIDPDHLNHLCDERQWSPALVIEFILTQQDEDVQYPKAPKMNLKRKRQDEDGPSTPPEKSAKKWDTEERRQERRANSYFKTRLVAL